MNHPFEVFTFLLFFGHNLNRTGIEIVKYVP